MTDAPKRLAPEAIGYGKRLLWLLLMMTSLLTAAAQTKKTDAEDDELALALLNHNDTIENPLYMPVAGFGIGYFGYHGEVSNSFTSLTVGKPGIRVFLSAYLGRKHLVRTNLTFITGSVFGTQRQVPPPPYEGVAEPGLLNNHNFKSDIYSFGFNLHYNFSPMIREKYLVPFVSLGIETMNFNSTADLLDANGIPYNYWSDGTIRSVPEFEGDPNNEFITQRDYVYETNLRSENKSGLNKYSNFTFAVPLEVGFDMNISDRMTVRVASSVHYMFTDLFDDLSPANKSPDYRGKKGNDWFTFSSLSLHIDLFSEDKIKLRKELFVNADDYDMAMYDDEDGDGVFDGWDDCPGTPPGVPVDTLGCPFDRDGDGVPDYLDREVSRGGVIVDEFGVEVNDATIVDLLGKPGLPRKDVAAYLSAAERTVRTRQSKPFPEKLKKYDGNKDGYLSFNELLKCINAYFDGTSDVSQEELLELNNYFFDQ